MCAAARCRRKTGLIPVGHPEKGRIVLCEEHQEESGLSEDPGFDVQDVIDAAADGDDGDELVAMVTDSPSQTQLQQEAEEADEALNLIQAMPIQNQDDIEFAAEALADAKGHWKRLEDMKRKATQPMNDALKEIRSWFKPAQDFYKECESTIKIKLSMYHERQEREQRKALAEAAEAVQEGTAQEVSTALAKMEQAEEPDITGLSYRTIWDFEVIDAEQVPRAFLQINEQALRLFVSQHQESAALPGVRFFSKTVVVSKSN
jgi:hypothetical protein